MRRDNIIILRATAAGFLLLVAACAGSPAPDIATSSMDANAAAEHVTRAIDLLGHGDEQAARAELRAAKRLEPANAQARVLEAELVQNPATLFGTRSFSYRVKTGDTMASLAQRYLGDRLMFYALARYNKLAAPSNMAVGQTLNIPNLGLRTSALPRPQPPSAPQRHAALIAAPPVQPAPASLAAQHDPAKARLLREKALVAMNRGSVDQAVELLRQAIQSDPSDPVTSRELERATRLAAAAHGR